MEKKTFKDAAGGFLSSWKQDYDTKNKDILERAEKRTAESKELHQQMLAQLDEVKADFSGKAELMLTHLKFQLDAFMTAVNKGAATLDEELQLEKRFDELAAFVKTSGQAGAQKFAVIAADFKSRAGSLVKEIPSSLSNLQDEAQKLADDSDKKVDAQNDQYKKDIEDLFK